jgi:hypothetical protein
LTLGADGADVGLGGAVSADVTDGTDIGGAVSAEEAVVGADVGGAMSADGAEVGTDVGDAVSTNGAEVGTDVGDAVSTKEAEVGADVGGAVSADGAEVEDTVRMEGAEEGVGGGGVDRAAETVDKSMINMNGSGLKDDSMSAHLIYRPHRWRVISSCILR